MNIISVEFCFFFIIVYSLYWLLRKKVLLQNTFIVAASYLFYAFIDWRFCFLLFGVTALSYCTGKYVSVNLHNERSKYAMILTIAFNIGILFLFKYYDFFATEIAGLLGLEQDKVILNLILPIGISFYTFTTTGYVVDVYKGKSKACDNIIQFICFISFFPLLLSGPIERSDNLLLQFGNRREFDYSKSSEGVQQVIWGAFKKIVIADNLSTTVKIVFSCYDDLTASALVIGAIMYSMQIYFDFSGYSDIAIGMSKLLGFNVRRNFHYPYFALNVSDFWRRWHMSLQSWLTDYIYYPLGGSRCSKSRTIFNTFVVFLACGIWHGSNWTFVVWGLYHAMLFVPLLLFLPKNFKKRTIETDGLIPQLSSLILIILNFILITVGWVIFNSPTTTDAFSFLSGILSPSIITPPYGIGLGDISYVIVLLLFILLFEWRFKELETPMFFKAPGWVKVVILYFLLGNILLCSASQSDFIYYQF